MKLLILQQVLLLLLQASAQGVHELMSISACSDSGGEDMRGLDGEQMFHADFRRQKMVDTLPSFADPEECPGCYDAAAAQQTVCKSNLKVLLKEHEGLPLLQDAPGAPLLYPRDHLKPSQPNTLVCQASGFYPAPVNFSWTRDGVNISWSSVSQAYPQSDGTFSQFSTLQLLPQDGQVYSCSLEHPALRGERRTRLWTVEFPKPSLAPSIFCAVGVTLGLVGVAVGIYFLVKRLSRRSQYERLE